MAAFPHGCKGSPPLTQATKVEKPGGFPATFLGASHRQFTNHITGMKRRWERHSHDASEPCPGQQRSRLEHAEQMSYYVGNVSAEMATVLRKDATILIRLREKMEVHLCTVSIQLATHSS